jgi:hypothetical protein
MRSRQLESSLTEFFGAASTYLRAEIAAGAEVPFELGAQSARRGGRAGTPLYTYRALTGQFIGEREAALKRLPGHAEVAKLLERFDGLDRYLLSVGGDAARATGRARVRAAVKTLLEEVFDEQTDFELRGERVRAVLERLQNATLASAGEVGLVATLHGVAIGSAELQLAKGLRIARPEAIDEMPDQAAALAGEDEHGHLIVAYAVQRDDVEQALLDGRAVMRDLLSALRLFGDGRVTLGGLAWGRVGVGPWNPFALGAGGRPHGMLVVTTEQEDELCAFCNLVSRRTPHDNDLAWALRRFELGCERETPFEALTDNLLALRALLEPEGPASGLLAGRLAVLCATAEQRADLTERVTRAIALERSLIAGTARKDAASRALADDVANHLRSLLRDVICGHLDPDLAVIADELLEPDELLHTDEPAPTGYEPQFAARAATGLDGPLDDEPADDRPDDNELSDDRPAGDAPTGGGFDDEFDTAAFEGDELAAEQADRGELSTRVALGAGEAGEPEPPELEHEPAEADHEILAAQLRRPLPAQSDAVAAADPVAPLR